MIITQEQYDAIERIAENTGNAELLASLEEDEIGQTTESMFVWTNYPEQSGHCFRVDPDGRAPYLWYDCLVSP